VQVEDVPALEEEIGKLVDDEAARAALGRRAEMVVAENRGMIERTVERLGGE